FRPTRSRLARCRCTPPRGAAPEACAASACCATRTPSCSRGSATVPPSRPPRPGRRSTCLRPSKSVTPRARRLRSRSQACRRRRVTSRSPRTCQTDAVFSRRLLPALALGGALLLGGCTGDDGESAPADERLDAAAQALADAESFDISL